MDTRGVATMYDGDHWMWGHGWGGGCLGTHQRGDGEHQRGLAAGAGNGADAAIQRRDALFKHGVGRVGDARIDVAGALLIEQGGGVVAALEDVAGGEVDRGGPRVVDRVGGLAGVQGERVGPGVSVDRHGVRGR